MLVTKSWVMVVGVLFLLLLSWLGASRNFIDLTRLRGHVTVIFTAVIIHDHPPISTQAVILMPSASILPLEIEETILELLAEDDDDNHSALKACSLVCQAFLPIGRKHIFGTIVLNDDDAISPITTHALARLLCETPEIADYIRKLDYNIAVADLTSPSIQESLKRISRLEFLAIWHHNRRNLDWSNNPIRPALLHLLHLPTLTHVEMSKINNFVASDLIPCINLKYLDIGFHTTGETETTFPAALPEKSIQLNEFKAAFGTASAITKLCTARRPDGQLVIDFGSLSKITVVLKKPNESEALQELFRRCQLLTDVDISCK
jgi:hypothetical protein